MTKIYQTSRLMADDGIDRHIYGGHHYTYLGIINRIYIKERRVVLFL